MKCRNLAFVLPKLDVVAINKALGLLHGLGVAGADKWDRFVNMTVVVDNVCAIFRHVAAPTLGGSANGLPVTDGCRDWGGDGDKGYINLTVLVCSVTDIGGLNTC
jgi:hypothetical protein